MASVRGFTNPRRALFTGLIVAVAVLAIAVFAVAFTHRALKGDPMPDELHQRQVAQGLPVGDRQPYGVEDFTEPNAK